jgi:hypothetical protein
MMKPTILRVALAMFMAAIMGTAALTWADDAATPPATSPSTPTSQPDQAAVQKFYGTVTAVDATAMTFVVADKTYTVTGETEMTKNSKPATLADAVVGEPARGSFTTSSDGKLQVTKVRFGKKTGGKGGGKKKSDSTSQPSNQ